MHVREEGEASEMREVFTTGHALWAMGITVVVSNFAVCFPINDFLTWGAFTYPLTFLVTELTNRFHGAAKARRVVYMGFFLGVVLSLFVAPVRISLASGTAFLCSQLLDIVLFSRFRQAAGACQGKWWYAPICASCIASLFDSMLFSILAFWGEDVPLLTWAIGDTAVKWVMDLCFLVPFRAILTLSARRQATRA